MAGTAAVASAVIAAVGTGHAIESSEQQKRKAGQVVSGQRQDIAAAEKKKSIEEANLKETEVQRINKQRQKALQANFGGRQSTILTGSLGGASSPAAVAGKTLLGA
jgi:hypothetical protein